MSATYTTPTTLAETVYPEITGYLRRGREVPPPAFPSACPCCGAALVETKEGEWSASAQYACGGTYEPKPQIQNHTRVWWGVCGGVA